MTRAPLGSRPVTYTCTFSLGHLFTMLRVSTPLAAAVDRGSASGGSLDALLDVRLAEATMRARGLGMRRPVPPVVALSFVLVGVASGRTLTANAALLLLMLLLLSRSVDSVRGGPGRPFHVVALRVL